VKARTFYPAAGKYLSIPSIIIVAAPMRRVVFCTIRSDHAALRTTVFRPEIFLQRSATTVERPKQERRG
jgi:hypothetical protein